MNFGQVEPVCRIGNPLWMYGVDDPDDLEAYLIEEEKDGIPGHKPGKDCIRKFESIQKAWDYVKLFQVVNPRVIPCVQSSSQDNRQQSLRV